MAGNENHVCMREAEIQDLKEKVNSIEKIHRGDHDLLIELKVDMKNVQTDLKEFISEVKTLINQPGMRWEKVKMALIIATVTTIGTFILSKMIGG